MKKHSLCAPMQRDGCAALASIVCRGGDTGMGAVASEKEGVDVLVAAMLLCAREKLDFDSGIRALRALATAHPDLRKRIERANGTKYLQHPDPEPLPDPEPNPEPTPMPIPMPMP